MTAALALLAYAGLLGVAGPKLMAYRGWTLRAPRLGIAAWSALAGSLVASLLLVGVTLAVPAVPVEGGLRRMARACAVAIGERLSTPTGTGLCLAGLAITAAVAGRLAWAATVTARHTGRRRRHHLQTLTLLGRAGAEPDVTVLDQDTAAAYCLPGRRRRIVVTTGAVAALSPAQLDAVLAHERAHLAGRHHLIRQAADALHRAFPAVPLLHAARGEVAVLTEILADQAATRRHRPHLLATALCDLATAATPAGALGAASGGGAAMIRLRRLLAPPTPLPAPARAATTAATVLAPAVALAITAAPWLLAVSLVCCPPA